MIRAATFSDLPRLLELLLEIQSKSKFCPDIDVDVPTARSILTTGVTRHGGTNNGSSCVFVEDHGGRVEGFIMGILDRVYHIGNRLVSNDLFLYCTDQARPRAASQLVDHYIEWAEKNPKVAYIMLSWTNALGDDAVKIEKLYLRKGFRHVGGIWERKGQ